MLAFSLCAIWYSLVWATAAVKHGTIGYGINMYRPWCCYACSDSLAMLYLNCTTFEEEPAEGDGMSMLKKRMMDMEMVGTTSDACHASSQPFQQTLSYCIKTQCDAEGVEYNEQNQCFRSLNFAGSTGPSLQQSLPAVAPTQELAEDAEWLNSTMLVNAVSWASDRGTIEQFERSEDDHVAWSMAILIVSVAVPLLTGVWLYVSSHLPLSLRNEGVAWATRSYLVLPALWSRKHSEPLKWRIGYLPSRSMSLWIAAYISLNVIGCAVGFGSVQPNTFFANKNDELAEYVANRSGVLSFANMALAILFSGRNNPLLYFSSWDHTTQLTFHRWAARVAILQAIVHSIVYTASYSYYKGENMYYSEAKKSYFWWGIIATTAMGLMAGVSALPLRKLAYEVFLFVHIALAILSLLGCWYHVELRFSKGWGYEVWLYLAFAFWAYDRLARLVRVVYNAVMVRPQAELETVPGTNVTMLTIKLKRALHVRPGQHIYVYFTSMGRFWESHPFTVCDWDVAHDTQPASRAQSIPDLETAQPESVDSGETDGPGTKGSMTLKERTVSVQSNQPYIRCLFRAHDGKTATTHARLSPGQLLKADIALEGTYGGHISKHQPLATADIVLCVAGGIGITFASGFARQMSRERSSTHNKNFRKTMPKCQHFTLAWSVREDALLAHCEAHLLPSLAGIDDGSMTYQFWQTGSGTGKSPSAQVAETGSSSSVASALVQRHMGRMDPQAVVSSVMAVGKRVVVLVCGPGSLADDVRVAVTRCAREGYVVDLIEESFCW